MRKQRDLSQYIKNNDDGLCQLDLAVDGITCAGCMAKIERELKAVPGVESARVNLTSHRLAITWQDSKVIPEVFLRALERIGYSAFPFDPEQVNASHKERSKYLLRALAIAGFAAMNIMLLSISIWAGNVSGITPATRDLMHWISALIAIPAVAYAGQPFFQSAITSIRAKNLNMDVPISLAVTLAVGMSLVQTFTGARDAYFDSAVMLLFFLLVGRFLDENMRRRTSDLAQNLITLQGQSATRIEPDGARIEVPLSSIKPGDEIHVAAGDRIGVDGVVISGASQVDLSLVTGETLPEKVAEGDRVIGGTLNLAGSLKIRATAVLEGTILAEISKLLENAAQVKTRYVRLADRAARAYVPLVHSAAALTLIGWLILGLGWQGALLNAISVLIITCPCALGLAVPVVQVVASGVLFRAGILVNSGDALERLAQVDYIVFDKTGTLTAPEPGLLNINEINKDDLALAGKLAVASNHPLARAVALAAGEDTPLDNITETAGQGISTILGGISLRLGSAEFCGVKTAPVPSENLTSTIWFVKGKEAPVAFHIAQKLRKDAAGTISRLRAMGLDMEILSGDTRDAVSALATSLGIKDWRSGLKPADKITRLAELESKGLKVLMVGDGLNDAPALSAAHASISPVSAADISRAAADFVFMGEDLGAVVTAIRVTRMSRRMMLQNLGFAAIYNMIAVPLAVLGYANPLVAALAMSGSSIVVTLNALRARLSLRERKTA